MSGNEKPVLFDAARHDRRAANVLARRSPAMLRLFGSLFARDLARTFDAVRCAGSWPTLPGPAVIYANHPSWWDGELFVWLAARAFADRTVLAPMDAAMLARYAFFGRLGAFPVAPGFTGASVFLAIGERVLARPDGLLLVNAEGRFRDCRLRPVEPAAGLRHLARRAPRASFVPLAIEYAFWDERRPNLLLRFGEPVAGAALIEDRHGSIPRDRLAATMDQLAADAMSRDPRRFHVMLEGRTGIHPVYDAWRGVRARLRGRRFEATHRRLPERLDP